MIAMFKDEYADFSIFQGLTAGQLRDLDTLLDFCRFPQGTVIFEQGKAAINLFILLAGEVVISYKPYDGPALTVARIQPGGVFGWSAALGRDMYTSGAVAEMEVEAYRIGSLDLQRFCERRPQTGAVLLDHLAGSIAERLQNTHTEILTILTKGMDLSDNGGRRIEKK